MITADLISYIRKQQNNNVSRDLIVSSLEKVGWHPEDIEEGFDKVEELNQRTNTSLSESEGPSDIDNTESSLLDRYREPIDLDAEPLAKKEIPLGVKKKEIIEPKKEEFVIEAKQEVVENPVIPEVQDFSKEEKKSGFNFNDLLKENSQAPKKDLVDVVNQFNIIIEKNESGQPESVYGPTDNGPIKEEPLLQTEKDNKLVEDVTTLNPVENKETEPVFEDVSPSTFILENQTTKEEKDPEPVVDLLELKRKIEQKIEEENKLNLVSDMNNEENSNLITQKENKTEKEPLVDPILSANVLEGGDVSNRVWLPRNVPVKEIESPEPVLVEQNIFPAKEENKIDLQNLEVPVKIKKEEALQGEKLISSDESRGSLIDDLPKIAPISTFSKDMEEAMEKARQEKSKTGLQRTKNKKLLKWGGLVLVILVLVGSLSWLFVTGKINLKNINIPFINKDPRSLIVKNSQLLASLDSYKAETILEIKTPSFANISAGLLTGEAIPSLDKDNLVIGSNAVFSRQNGEMLSDNSISVSGTILEEFVSGRIHSDGKNTYLSFPDLSKVLKETTTLKGSIKIDNQEFYLVSSLFGPRASRIVEKIKLQKILTSGISSYIDEETLGSYDDLIKNVQITKKGEEVIKGVNTIHYSINPDKELFKNLIKKILERFSGDINDTDLSNIDTVIGSTKVSSFDVWVGKGNNAIYQYNIVLEIPMTKVFGFEDKSIGNDTMSISFKVTYFDFNLPNNISIPNGYTEISEFVKSAKIENVKNKVREFIVLADNLKKIEKKYGVKPNPQGSCMEPVAGSLFSPTGHSKSAVLPVSEISSFLNYTLGLTKGLGSCYSTTTDWSFAIPLTDNYENIATSEIFDKYYCVDSKGGDIEISTLPKGTICEQEIDLKP